MKKIKLIVLDLDGVLWEGKCAEGIQDLALNKLLIDILRDLKNNGYIITLLSRNYPMVAEGTLNSFGLLELFSDWEISLDSKEIGMARLINRLNILPHNILFIDDSPFERHLIQANYPDIQVYDLERGTDFLKKLKSTKIKSDKTAQVQRSNYYRCNRKREKFLASFLGSESKYLEDLNTKIYLIPFRKRFLSRLKEMLTRNQQFNTSSLSSDLNTLTTKILEKKIKITLISVEDIFGPYGVAGCIITKFDPSKKILFIDEMSFSCRIHRPHIIVSAIKAFIKHESNNQGTVKIKYHSTPYNKHLTRIFSELNLKRISSNSKTYLFTNKIFNIDLSIPEYISVFFKNTLSKTEDSSGIPFITNNFLNIFSNKKVRGIILDIGAGENQVLGKNFIRQFILKQDNLKYYTVDYDKEYNPHLLMDARKLGFRDLTVDYIFSLEVIEHIDKFWEAINEFLRILKLNGQIIISAPLNFEIHNSSSDYYRFTPLGLRKLLEQSSVVTGKNKYTFSVRNVITEGDATFPIRTLLIANKISNKGAKNEFGKNI